MRHKWASGSIDGQLHVSTEPTDARAAEPPSQRRRAAERKRTCSLLREPMSDCHCGASPCCRLIITKCDQDKNKFYLLVIHRWP